MYRGCVIIKELACLCRTVCVFSVCYFSILVNTLFCFPEENPNQWHNQFLWRWTSKFRTWHSRKRNLCNDFSYTCISIPCASLIFLKNSSRKFMNLLKFLSYVQYQEIKSSFTGLCVGRGARYSNQKMHPISSQNSRCQYFWPVNMGSIDAAKWMQVRWDGSYKSNLIKGYLSCILQKLIFFFLKYWMQWW